MKEMKQKRSVNRRSELYWLTWRATASLPGGDSAEPERLRLGRSRCAVAFGGLSDYLR
jgi:hypothetical protein